MMNVLESRYVQSLQLKVQPAQLNYSPDGKTVLFTTSLKLLNGLTYGKQGDETKDQWHLWDKESVSVEVARRVESRRLNTLHDRYLLPPSHSTMLGTDLS